MLTSHELQGVFAGSSAVSACAEPEVGCVGIGCLGAVVAGFWLKLATAPIPFLAFGRLSIQSVPPYDAKMFGLCLPHSDLVSFPLVAIALLNLHFKIKTLQDILCQACINRHNHFCFYS
ncbi:hypothetical protein F0562_028741 [Nyssa sinensis]|uniref:Uncharacterized protein n=1 Tax=Nyssa sinensis TaxID=561372 RepID=A0A5J5AZ00_9ASTE|nr:hypothetical protein F0562_028741 [Nyssa sinensis]